MSEYSVRGIYAVNDRSDYYTMNDSLGRHDRRYLSQVTSKTVE